MKIKTEYRNRLPHLAPIGATFFVTFNLADSLPRHIVSHLQITSQSRIEQLEKDRPPGYQKEIENEHCRFFHLYEKYFDTDPYGKCYLRQSEVASVVKDKLHEFDGKWYDLLAYCIMPNHVHLLIDTSVQLTDENEMFYDTVPTNYIQLHQIMHRIKGGTAYAANRLLGRKGLFWRKDSYDRYIRNQAECERIAQYIIQNPVEARLVSQWDEYLHTYIKNN